ncbi:hypothetical protein DM01DRAFT_1374227 [Hesseltinella vesiculosa]|uniref:dolichol kinase n=1 Tax=Hesseltinella vesiculosa TaxID=101127 RepID=A0A1X2GHS4_9FUNG|nr:hypothetical protein DM01DRAFT_1374227 [Hesseltinella vesiculosa]
MTTDAHYDEGFASSSSLDDSQTKEVLRRRRRQSSLGTSVTKTSPSDLLASFPVDTLIAAEPSERLIWISSYFWATYQYISLPDNTLPINTILVWTGLILCGLMVCHVSSRSNQNSKTRSFEKSTTDSSSDDLLLSPTLKSPLHRQTFDAPDPSLPAPTNRIFGASRAAFRMDADDGLLCGALLLIMVAYAQMIHVMDTYENLLLVTWMQAKLELILLMSLIFLILVSASGVLHPVKRIIRKRGLFVSSILVSGIVTFIITRLTSLTPILGSTPIWLTVFSIVAYQWSMYLCVVALKRCFTLGEMSVISQGAAVMVNMATETLWATYSEAVPTYIKTNRMGQETVMIHAVILGMVIVGVALYPLLRYCRKLAQRPYWRSQSSSDTLQSIQRRKIICAVSVYALTALVVTLIVTPVCTTLLHQNPFLWTLDFVFSSPPRLFLCMYWATTIGITVVAWVLLLDLPSNAYQNGVPENQSRAKKLTSALNKKRKLFHGLAVLMFDSFLRLAFGVALATFIYLEYLRYFAVWPYGKNIHMFLTEFIDNRDLGPVILSHMYLLIGCASPVWLGSSNLFASLSGILSLGFGDAAASLVGKRFGRWHWPGSKKTVEGTMSFIITVFLSMLVILYTSALIRVDSAMTTLANMDVGDWTRYLLVVIAAALLEAFSLQNDNIIIPLFLYALVIFSQDHSQLSLSYQ